MSEPNGVIARYTRDDITFVWEGGPIARISRTEFDPYGLLPDAPRVGNVFGYGPLLVRCVAITPGYVDLEQV
jgi:hypothetical protein